MKKSGVLKVFWKVNFKFGQVDFVNTKRAISYLYARLRSGSYGMLAANCNLCEMLFTHSP